MRSIWLNLKLDQFVPDGTPSWSPSQCATSGHAAACKTVEGDLNAGEVVCDSGNISSSRFHGDIALRLKA
jgi:hypothetical protein